MILIAVGVRMMIVHRWLVGDAMDLLAATVAVCCRCSDMASIIRKGEKCIHAPIILQGINMIDLTQSGADI